MSQERIQRCSAIAIVVFLIGLMWLFPLAILPAPVRKAGIVAGGMFLALTLSGVWYALGKCETSK
jgi:NADH:ubiquinone oxidoreductase subunit 3 (subunit A)